MYSNLTLHINKSPIKKKERAKSRKKEGGNKDGWEGEKDEGGEKEEMVEKEKKKKKISSSWPAGLVEYYFWVQSSIHIS